MKPATFRLSREALRKLRQEKRGSDPYKKDRKVIRE